MNSGFSENDKMQNICLQTSHGLITLLELAFYW
jgi:hypothetical protein